MSAPSDVIRVFKILALAVAIAVPAEGIRRVAYEDSGGIWTACMGTTKNVRPGQTFSMEQCHELLSDDMLDAIATVDRCAPGLQDHVVAALADAVYNLGPRIVCDIHTSTLARRLREGRVEDACNELTKWDKARVAGVLVALPGLTKRRERERQLCLTGVM